MTQADHVLRYGSNVARWKAWDETWAKITPLDKRPDIKPIKVRSKQ